MRFHVSQKHIAIILLPIFDKLQYVVSICHNASQGTISCFWNKFLSKNYNHQNTDNGRSSITSCAYRDSISCNIIVDFWYCLACCILYSTKSKDTSMKRSASAHVSLKIDNASFFSLLRAYCFPSKIEKVPRGIRGEKSSKDMASSRNLVSTIGALASPKMGDGTRCPEG